jgi:GNAT superfamily N-acetyltransferase
MAGSGYSFILCSWQGDAATIRALREQVLINEMGLSCGEFDASGDEGAFHVLVHDAGGRTIGAARMQRDGRIDYVVVLRPWRRKTVGGGLLSYLHHIAHVHRLEQIWSVVPDAARQFFEKNHFAPCGDQLPTAVIPGEKYFRAVQQSDGGVSVRH